MKVPSLEAHRPAVLAAWDHHIPQVLQHSDALSPMLAHHAHVVGKLLRPALTLAFFDLLQGKAATAHETAQISQAAIAIELLHNGTLVHDDLQDGDEIRRGHPTVWKAFSPYQAINTGSALYFHAQRLLATLDLDPATVVQLNRYLCDCSLEIIDGQAAEKNLWPQIQPTDDGRFPALPQDEAVSTYLTIVQKKTSALFALPMLLAGTIAGESPDTLAHIDAVANPLGALFQIQDDLLDLYGDKGRDTAGNDIAEGKPSLPALLTIYRANPDHASRLFALIQQPRDKTEASEIAWAIDLIREVGGLQASLGTIDRLRTEALDRCRALPLRVPPKPLADFLDGLCDTILKPIEHLYKRES